MQSVPFELILTRARWMVNCSFFSVVLDSNMCSIVCVFFSFFCWLLLSLSWSLCHILYILSLSIFFSLSLRATTLNITTLLTPSKKKTKQFSCRKPDTQSNISHWTVWPFRHHILLSYANVLHVRHTISWNTFIPLIFSWVFVRNMWCNGKKTNCIEWSGGVEQMPFVKFAIDKPWNWASFCLVSCFFGPEIQVIFTLETLYNRIIIQSFERRRKQNEMFVYRDGMKWKWMNQKQNIENILMKQNDSHSSGACAQNSLIEWTKS